MVLGDLHMGYDVVSARSGKSLSTALKQGPFPTDSRDMRFTDTPIPGVHVIELEPRGDERGFFARAFCTDELTQHGLVGHVAQANNSFSVDKGTLRGMHYQLAPASEVKIVRCIRGVAVGRRARRPGRLADLRPVVRRRAQRREPPRHVRPGRGSPTAS